MRVRCSYDAADVQVRAGFSLIKIFPFTQGRRRGARRLPFATGGNTPADAGSTCIRGRSLLCRVSVLKIYLPVRPMSRR